MDGRVIALRRLQFLLKHRDDTPLLVNFLGLQLQFFIKSRDVLVFVHGFNTSFEDAALRAAQIAADIGFDGSLDTSIAIRTVLMDGKDVNSCDVPLWSAAGRRIVTVEGLGTRGQPHPLQQSFLEHQAAQCGYCTTGMIVAAKAAKQAGMTVIAGAPNLVRGGSHTGNVSASDLMDAGAVDAFASDYVPPSLVEAAFLSARDL